MLTLQNLCIEIDKWEVVPLKAATDRALEINERRKQHKEPNPPGFHMDISQGVPAVDMYCYLRSKFGPPNGVQMLLKNQNDVDNLIHWAYELQYKDAYIHITGFFFHFSFLISGLTGNPNEHQEYFQKFLAKTIKNSPFEVQRAKASLEEWFVFSNPYFQFSSMVEELIEEIQSEPPLQRYNHRPKDASLVEKAGKTNSQIVLSTFRRRITLKLVIPIWIESFINLVIFVCAKPEFRITEAEFSDYKKSHWRNRLRKFHSNCLGFQKPIDMDSTAVKKIEPLFSTRNRLLHGAFAPEITGKKIYFADRFTPLMAECSYLTDFLHDISLHGLSIDELDNEIEMARDFIAYILESMDTDIATQLLRLMNDSTPGWDTKRLISGSVLPAQFVDMFPVTK